MFHASPFSSPPPSLPSSACLKHSVEHLVCNSEGSRRRRMAPPGSHRWAYVRIMAGTILGGALGFYVMHRVETSYKEKMQERLRRYEAQMLAKAKETKQEPQPQLLHEEAQNKDQAQILPD